MFLLTRVCVCSPLPGPGRGGARRPRWFRFRRGGRRFLRARGRAAGMARSTLSSRFRRLDIDQYDENRFVEEPEEAAAAEPDAGPEVEALLRQYPLGRGGRGSPGAGARRSRGAGPRGGSAARVAFESLTRRRTGEALRAFHTAIRSSPGNTRNQAMKVTGRGAGPRCRGALRGQRHPRELSSTAVVNELVLAWGIPLCSLFLLLHQNCSPR